ncbi:PREDICTED: protein MICRORCHIDIA 4-like isoform X2 [Camelina sativa]|uniref:Protein MICRORCHIDIA 4-like isoform X2 n=1 Tax=Camelina sativa TaxID=90675 RepID=A0ABM0X8S0_CAMSA|nr:PREDICTED: protein MICRORCHIDIA 4-like isoform X2 [Camelina sativa]
MVRIRRSRYTEILLPTSTTLSTWKPAAGSSIVPRRESGEVIEVSSSDDDEGGSELGETANDVETVDLRTGNDVSGTKRARGDSVASPAKKLAFMIPDDEEGFPQVLALPATPCNVVAAPSPSAWGSCKQFWKAGDYEGTSGGDWEVSAGGFDHVRVHPKFLHSNATSHKWSLGAFAELLDNALDEVQTGATFVNVDMIQNRKDGSKMVLIEDDGGGMNPEKMRHCMSLGYSAKSKLADTIGQYGNGFKTSTMRLGADVIVFSRCSGKDGNSSTQSIGLLSYTFLKSTGKEDIVVPMLDYERRGSEWCPIMRSSVSDWDKNVDTVVQWSPFATEEDLLRQFNLVKNHGTRIIIYNLWEDDQGMLELDFDTDPHDIQLRGVNRDEKNIDMASRFPNSRHFLTYKHSLRSYASILYLKIANGFRIILRGKDVEYHNIVNDMMHTEKITYRPKEGADGCAKYSNLSAVVTIGFVKDAIHHVDVQGFNVYHKNRLIKPFWRIWNAAGSDGRGVIGVLEANFVEPAHDKQGFERTTVLSRLEARLLQMQKDYWKSKCHKIGYAPRQGKKSAKNTEEDRESSPEYDRKGAVSSRRRTAASSFKTSTAATSFKTSTAASEKFNTRSNVNGGGKGSVKGSRDTGYKSSEKGGKLGNSSSKSNQRAKPQGARALEVINSDDDYDPDSSPERNVTDLHEKSSELPKPQSGSPTLSQLEQENKELRERLDKKEEVFLLLQKDVRREKELRKTLEAEVETLKKKLEETEKEQENLIDVFSQERDRRDMEEENLRNKLEEASNTIQKLLDGKAGGRR